MGRPSCISERRCSFLFLVEMKISREHGKQPKGANAACYLTQRSYYSSARAFPALTTKYRYELHERYQRPALTLHCRYHKSLSLVLHPIFVLCFPLLLLLCLLKHIHPCPRRSAPSLLHIIPAYTIPPATSNRNSTTHASLTTLDISETPSPAILRTPPLRTSSHESLNRPATASQRCEASLSA